MSASTCAVLSLERRAGSARQRRRRRARRAERRAYAREQIARLIKIPQPTGKHLAAYRQPHQILAEADRREAKEAMRQPATPERPKGEYSEFVLGLLAEELARDKAITESKPCECDQPLPRSWDPRDGFPVCHRCRLVVKSAAVGVP